MASYDAGTERLPTKTLLLTVFFPPQIGGLEHFWGEIAQRWPKDRLVVWTAPNKQADDTTQAAMVLRKHFFSWKITPSWLPLFWQLPRVIREHKIKRLLFGHYVNFAILGPWLRFTMGTRYDLMSHGIDTILPKKKWFSRLVFHLVLKYADRLYANSKQTAAHFGDAAAIRKKIIIAYPGIDFHNVVKNKTAGPKDTCRILSLGRLVQVKGIHNALRAIAQLPKNVNVHYDIVGDGPERSRLEQLTRDLDLTTKVSFHGEISPTSESKHMWYDDADLFLFPSENIDGHQESFGIVVLEAAQYSLPVIAGRESGASEVIIDGQTGLLVPSRQPKSFAQAILDLIEHPEKAEVLGQRLNEHVRTSFQWHATVEAIANV